MSTSPDSRENDIEPGAAESPEAPAQAPTGASGDPAANPGANPQVARFGEVSQEGATGGEVDLEAILDVPVNLSLEVGRASITIGELLKLNQGSVIELKRSAMEPMDVLVNGTIVARGEIVVVDESFGIRLVDVVAPAERIRRLT